MMSKTAELSVREIRIKREIKIDLELRKRQNDLQLNYIVKEKEYIFILFSKLSFQLTYMSIFPYIYCSALSEDGEVNCQELISELIL